MTPPRVGIVVVSHSRGLAEAAVALARQMVGAGEPPLEVAAGTADGGLGTDAAAVARAMTDVAGAVAAVPGAGVLVLMDLGSAVLSAELALELAGDLPVPVRLCAGPLVEGLVAALVQAGAGSGLDEVAAEAGNALAAKQAQVGDEAAAPMPASDAGTPAVAVPDPIATVVTLVNAHGLHARPAAALVSLARRFDAAVRVAGVNASSITAVSALGAGQGQEVVISATGRQARQAVDAVAALVSAGFGEPAAPPGPTSGPVPDRPHPWQVPGASTPDGPLMGLPASPGVAIGPVWRLEADLPPLPESTARDPAAEAAALDEALAEVRRSLADTRQLATARAGPGGAAIFDAHALLLDDAALLDAAREAVAAGAPAARAWAQASERAAARLDDLTDPYLRARAADVRSVTLQVVRALLGRAAGASAAAGVVVAGDVSPNDVARFDPRCVVAVVTTAGSPSSHAAILARSTGIPLVVAVGPGVDALAAGDLVAVDGGSGLVEVNPSHSRRAEWTRRAEEEFARRDAARSRAHQPAVTLDGTTVSVEANVRSAEDAAAALAGGAEGVGLLRTEFLFLDRTDAPSEAEQVQAYDGVATAMAGRRVTIRTLDVGGDKPLPYVDLPAEANPFLGLRGLRLALRRRDLLDPQLRAVVRAAADHPVAVMVPMVTTVAEVRAARAALDAAVTAVGLEAPPPGLEFGIMVEVPAAALRAAHLAPLVDFMSIGTNDLTQYVVAAERGNPDVAGLGDGLDPTVLRLVDEVCRAAARHGTRVAVCGELAGDPVAVPVLVGLGVRELSVGAGSVAAVKDVVRGLRLDEAEGLARQALALSSAAEVRALVT